MSETALADATRVFAFLAQQDTDAAIAAGKALSAGISRLAYYPESVPLFDDMFRILTVPFGKRGYSVAYIYEAAQDTVIILGIKHQAEEYFPFELAENVAPDDNT